MAGKSLGDLTVNVIANTGSYEQTMKKAEGSTRKFTESAERQGEAFNRLQGEIDPTIAAYTRLDKAQQELNKFRKKNVVDSEEYSRLTSKINAQKDAVKKNADAYGGNAKTARELAFATRNLPAQFTDIVVGIQGGQAPLTILLQQGGQIKDMFGGVVPAIKKMWEVLAASVNPLTVSLAILGTLAIAFSKVVSENNAITKSIILTGNAAGVTKDQIIGLAEAIDDVVGTQGKAIAVLNAITSSGKFTADQFDEIARAAIRFERAAGIAIEDTLAEFEKVNEGPTEALLELGKKYGFLTTEIYKQVTALERQGDAAAAAEIVMRELAVSKELMSAKIVEEQNFIMRFFRANIDAFKEQFDTIKNINRAIFGEANLTEEVANIESAILNLQAAMISEDDLQLIALKERLVLKKEELEASQSIARAESDRLRVLSLGTDAEQEISEALKDAQTNAEKLVLRYAEIEKQVRAAAAAGFEFTEAQINLLREVAKEQYSAKGNTAFSDDSAIKLLSTLREQEALLIQQQLSSVKLGAATQALIKFEEEISHLKNKEILTADQQSILANEELLRIQYQINQGLEQGLAFQENRLALEKEFEGLQDSLRTKEEASVDVTLERLAVLERANAAQLDQIEYTKTLNQILDQSLGSDSAPTSSFSNFGSSSEEGKVQKERDKLKEWHEEKLALLEMYREASSERSEYWNERELEVQREFLAASIQLDLAQTNVRLEEANKEFKKFAIEAGKNIQNAFADFLFDPFADGLRGMVKGVVDTLKRIVAEVYATKLLMAGANLLANSANPLAAAFGSALGGTAMVGPPSPFIRDSGGDGVAGRPYMIGTGAQPEMFVPNTAGTFIPNADQLGGKNSFEFNIDARDAGAEARIMDMINKQVIPRVVEMATNNTVSKMNRPRFS